MVRRKFFFGKAARKTKKLTIAEILSGQPAQKKKDQVEIDGEIITLNSSDGDESPQKFHLKKPKKDKEDNGPLNLTVDNTGNPLQDLVTHEPLEIEEERKTNPPKLDDSLDSNAWVNSSSSSSVEPDKNPIFGNKVQNAIDMLGARYSKTNF